ncbi:MAG TPA: VOC family protein [Blastocatellia bacterium]|nr:VOC family protein [Blastocatellia bacterium]
MNLNQVTVPSVDVAGSVGFYRRLGLIQVVGNLPKYARFVCPDGNSTFSIHHVESRPALPGVVVYFECEHPDDEVARLKSQGIVFDSDLQDQSWLWREACLSDPDGNVICLYSAGDNRLNPPWRLR